MDFRKAFFPTEEERQKQMELIQSIVYEEKNFWLCKGLTEEEYRLLMEKESIEFRSLHPFQEWIPRRILLEDGVISIDDVLKEIN